MIKRAMENDAFILAKLAIEMWKNNTIDELKKEFVEILNSDKSACFIKYIDNEPIGFSQCSIRCDYVEGCDTSFVGYLEGVYIKTKYRKNGYGKELVSECEKWAKEKGCLEFASDCELVNKESLEFHKKIGFKEMNRIICFKKIIKK